MFKKLKGLTILLVVALMAITLAACGGSKDKNQNNAGNNNTDQEKEETYDITMAFLATSNVKDVELVQEEINKITKEKINATVTMLPISPSAWAQQMNLMMTGNEKLDLLVTGSDLGYSLQATAGQLVGLDELLDNYGSGIKDVVSEDVLNATRVGGEIYGVPSVRDWAADYGFYMRKDIVEKYDIDLDSIKTYDDLTPIFETVKQNEPDMYPIANTTAPVGEIVTGEYYDVLGDRLGVVSMDEDGEVVNLFEQQDYIDGVGLVRDWYDAGYIMKDSTTTEDTAIAVIKSGKGFGAFSVMKPGFEIQESTFIGQEMVGVRLTEPYQYTRFITSFMMSIARNSENPEKAMEFMNLLYTDADVMNLVANGIEGKHYALNDDGLATLPEGVEESDYFLGQWQIGNNFLTHVWEGNEADLWEQTKEFNDNAVKSPVFGFLFDPSEVKTEMASLNNVIEQYKKGIESGTLDPDKNIPELVEKLKASGLDEVIKEKQKQIDEWKANQ